MVGRRRHGRLIPPYGLGEEKKTDGGPAAAGPPCPTLPASALSASSAVDLFPLLLHLHIEPRVEQGLDHFARLELAFDRERALLGLDVGAAHAADGSYGLFD